MFNFPNHPVWGIPGQTFATPTFDEVTGTRSTNAKSSSPSVTLKSAVFSQGGSNNWELGELTESRFFPPSLLPVRRPIGFPHAMRVREPTAGSRNQFPRHRALSAPYPPRRSSK